MKLRTIVAGLGAGIVLLLAGAAEAGEVPPPLHTAAGLYYACTNLDTSAMNGNCVGAITAHRRWCSAVRHSVVRWVGVGFRC